MEMLNHHIQRFYFFNSDSEYAEVVKGFIDEIKFLMIWYFHGK